MAFRPDFYEAVPADRPVGRGFHLAGHRCQSSGPASVFPLTPAALGVSKARRAGLLAGMDSPCFPLRCWLGVVVDDGSGVKFLLGLLN